MTSKWDQYKVDTNVEATPSKWDQYAVKEEPKTDWAEEIKQTLLAWPRVAASTAGSTLTGTMKGIGGLLEMLSKIGEEGEPGEIKGMGTRAMRTAGQFLREGGQEAKETWQKGQEALLGQPASDIERSFTELGERWGDIISLPGMGKAAAAPAFLGATSAQAGKEFGVGERGQTLLELLGFGIKDLKKLGKLFTREAPKTVSGLELPRVAQREGKGFKFFKPIISEGRKKRVQEKLATQATELIGNIKKERLPVSEEIEKGIDVAARNEKLFEKVSGIAEKLPGKIESKHISDYLETVEKNILTKSPVPTQEEKQILKLIQEYKSAFGETEGGVRFYKPKEYLNQFRNINKDAKKLFETEFVHGKRLDTMNFYEGLKDSIEKTFEGNTPKEFSNLFKETNQEFSQLKRLEEFETIMENVSKDGILDPSKLETYIKNPKKANVLRKQIGKEGFEQMKEISKDLSKAKKNLGLIEEKGLLGIVKSPSTYLAPALQAFGMTKTAGLSLAPQIIKRIRGWYLTNPAGKKITTNLLKAVRTGNEKAIGKQLILFNDKLRELEKEED